MATKEERYPKEYKPFPNDKTISSFQGNNNSSSDSSGSSSGKQQQPEPIYPQSTGVKLRNVEDIINDYSKKTPPQESAAAAPSLSLSTATIANKPLPPNATSIQRVANKSQRPLELIPDEFKAVLQNLTDTRRKPVAITSSKPHGSTASSNTPQKSSTIKLSTISPQDSKSKKQFTPISNPYPKTRPRVSSKKIPMEKVTQIENVPDLLEAREYIVGPDEVEFQSLSSLQQMPKDMHVKERPQLFIRLNPKPNKSDMPKALKQHTASASINNIKSKQEKLALSSNKKDQFKTSTHSKSATPSLPSDPSTKSVGKTTNFKKQLQSDQSQAPIRTSTSKKSTTVKAEGATTHTTIESEKQDYASSVSAEFLRSTKIPERSNNVNKLSDDMELEDGETISPSPSPIRTKSRSSHMEVDEKSSNVERPAARKAFTVAVIAPPPTTTTTTATITSNKRKSLHDASDSSIASTSSEPPTKRPFTISSSTSTNTTLSAVNVPDKVVSATAPNAETPEQYKVFAIMFNQLALAHKRRGDTQKDPVIGIIDHFHALCDYMLNFYYIDKGNTDIPMKQVLIGWKSLFSLSDSLLSKLQANHLNEMYGLCIRLVALIRYYIYSRMESAIRPLLTKHLSGNSGGGIQDSTYTDLICIEMTEGLLREHEKAEKCYRESEKYMTLGKVATQFPGTFKDVCIDGNLLAGITLGGEAGVSVGPMFPFTPYSPLHHAAITAKCILNEYVTKNHLNFSPITQPEKFM